jgi:ankyrin repeat protein
MRKIAKRENKQNQKFLLLQSIRLLVRSDSKMLSWPNSPPPVLLQFVDPDVLSGDESAPLAQGEGRTTALHHLADLTDPFDYSTHENQLILAKQLIAHGANVNAACIPEGETPLHRASYAGVVINLDFVELLLEVGADPNAQDHLGQSPLMFTLPFSSGAANFLLNSPTTDANITNRSGVSFLARVRSTITTVSDAIARPDNTTKIQDEFLLQQWSEIEVMLVERGAT